MNSDWFVYILRTASGSLYTGITTDVARRVDEHSTAIKGAKSLRGKGPLVLLFQLSASDRSEASRLEALIKKLPRSDKEKLAAGNKNILTEIKSKCESQ